MVADHGSYNVTTYIETTKNKTKEKRKKRKRKRKETKI